MSAAPLVLYPDCYGIDMSTIGSLIAFQATVALLQEDNKKDLLRNYRPIMLNRAQ